jgi:hypothetical protein
MRVGIPWISLDSLVRIEIFQWVTRHSAERFFFTRFCPVARTPERESRRFGVRKGRIAHGESLTVSDFLQDISTRAEARE